MKKSTIALTATLGALLALLLAFTVIVGVTVRAAARDFVGNGSPAAGQERETAP